VQIGFALAKRLGHSQVYPIDVPGPMDFQPSLTYAERLQPGIYQRFMADMDGVKLQMSTLHQGRTVRDTLRAMNDPRQIAEDHDMYLNLNQIGAGDSYDGAALVSGWYQRNLRIFANLQRLAQPDNRVLVIYGSGHAAILRELIRGNREMRLVETSDYL
jgi:hypothetical protein